MNGEQIREVERIHNPAYELALSITRQSWLDAGMTPEELEHDAQIAEAFNRWVEAGHAPEEFSTPAIGSTITGGNATRPDAPPTSAPQTQHPAGRA